MKRNENENFEDYKLRRKAANAELKLKRKGVYKTVKIDGEEVEIKHTGDNRRARRDTGGRLFSNKKGIQLVVVKTPTGFMKFRKEVQVIPKHLKWVGDEDMTEGEYVKVPRKQITHSVEV